MTAPFEPVFYSLPAECVEEGMSTADGQDFLEDMCQIGDQSWGANVYTPRPDDEELDAENRDQPEYRMYSRGERVDLAVFEDTEVDGRDHPMAVYVE